MTDNTQPEALDLADWLEAVGGGPSAKRCAALLREQHALLDEQQRTIAALNSCIGCETTTENLTVVGRLEARIAELEAQLKSIGAGGVQPLRSVQEGCKLVPLEPTPEMLAALMSPGEAEVLASSPSETFALMLMDRAGIRERYSAMLGAAPQQEAQVPVAYVHVPHSTVEGKVRPVVSFEKYQQDYADGIYSTRIPLYAAPQPAPDCHHRPPCDECAAIAAQGGKV